MHISHSTINKFYKLFHERILELCEAESPFENGEIELSSILEQGGFAERGG